MNNALTDEELRSIWKKQKAVLAFRRPQWILSSFLMPAILVSLQALFLTPEQQRLGSVLKTSGIAYLVYTLFALGIYGFLLRTEHKKARSKPQLHLMAWLYGAFDMSSLTLASLLLLSLGFLVVEATGLSLSAVRLVKIGITILYLLISLSAIIFTPYLLRRKYQAVKPGLGMEVKWAIAIPVFLTVLGVSIGQMLSRTGQFKAGVAILAGLSWIASFALASICMQGIRLFITMAYHGFSTYTE